MAFDKNNAMRNAEKLLAQGKIKAAIGEYKSVVRHDPKDIGTTNLLGDLLFKNGDTAEAVKCYTTVGSHYAQQGFFAKAIAVYKKIAKLQSGPEISKELAELYKAKGSASEARQHFQIVADHYQKEGRTLEALDVLKEVALLDPKNTEVYQQLGESYLKEGYSAEAAEAFSAHGLRLQSLGRCDEAVAAFDRAIELDGNCRDALAGWCEAKFAEGDLAAAAKRIGELLEDNPRDAELIKILYDCHLRSGDPKSAEEQLLKLVESNPEDFPLCLELADLYLEQDDATSSARMLVLSSEYLLVAGRFDDLNLGVANVLERFPEQIEALRLLCDLHTWQRNESALIETLRRLLETARGAGSLEDERFAVSQLSMLVPSETEHAERVRELNEELGVDVDVTPLAEDEFAARFATHLTNSAGEALGDGDSTGFEFIADGGPAEFEVDSSVFVSAEAISHGGESFETPVSEDPVAGTEPAADDHDDVLAKEIEGIRFYIESGYADLALKAAEELKQDFGDRPEIRALIDEIGPVPVEEAAAPVDEMPAAAPAAPASNNGAFDLTDLYAELGMDEAAEDHSSEDYDTHYNTAIAYKEMGLLEDAITEFQSAASLVSANDGTRRLFSCANLLGLCFMEIGKPNLALTWYQRTLETPNLTDDEKQAVWYEIATAYQADGDQGNAARYFEQVYAENINYRDVGDRLRDLAVAA
jgi:tetratricopeptide (TPR) repeat protein